jgi:2-isopropylmalate synthase
MKPVLLYDTTLRDGVQGENIHFTADQKLTVAKKLDEFGIHYIEGGWPGSNPVDRHFFELAKKTDFTNSKIVAFGSTRKPWISPDQDENLHSLVSSQAPVITIFGKTWNLHVEKVMKITLEENLSMIRGSLAYLKASGREVIYDAEHFFDGYKEDPEYAIKTLCAARDGNADAIVLCDTNGGTMVHEIEEIMHSVNNNFLNTYISKSEKAHIKIGIHTHNDCGLAVANTIAGVRNGAAIVQGTINGYGERCGNADLTSIIPILCCKMNIKCIGLKNMANLKNVSRFVSEIANTVPLKSRPFVGQSAFTHKAGSHVNAVRKEPRAYEHIEPEKVGNTRRVLVSDLSGKSNVEYKAEDFGIKLPENTPDSRKIVLEIKEREEQGYQYDAADGSLKILMQKLTNQFEHEFQLESFRVTVEKNKDMPCMAHATVKVSVGGRHEFTAAEGDGPVSALDNAIRKALGKFFPDIDSMRLVDFKVRVIDGRAGTAAKVRVLIDSRDRDHVWSTVGVSDDIIEASWQALADSFQYKLARGHSKFDK